MAPNWRRLLTSAIKEEELKALRAHERTGRPLGDENFLALLEQNLGRISSNFSKTPGMGCSESFRANRSAETKHRRPDPAFKPPAPPSGSRRRGWNSPGRGLLRLPADQIRQPRDFTQASYAILEILPEVDSQPPARLLQARKGVPRTRPKSLRVLPLIFRFLT